MDAPASLTIDPIDILGEEGGRFKRSRGVPRTSREMMRMEGDTKEKMGHVPTSPLTQRPRSGLVCAYAHASLWLRTPNFNSAELLSAQAWLAW